MVFRRTCLLCCAALLLARFAASMAAEPPASAPNTLGEQEKQAGWKLIYRDRVAAFFARADSPAAHLPGVPVTGTPPPNYFP